MPNVTKEQEKAVRDAIKVKIEKFSAIKNVFTRRRFISSRADYYRKLGKTVAGNRTEISFAEIRFLGWTDDENEGFEKTPAIILQYQIHLFLEFADERSDGSNSDDDFTGAILDLRNEFLLNSNIGDYGKGEPLTNDVFAQFGNDTLSDAEGHFIDLRLDVKHRAIC